MVDDVHARQADGGGGGHRDVEADSSSCYARQSIGVGGLDDVHVRTGMWGHRREVHGALSVGGQDLLVEHLERPLADEAVDDGRTRGAGLLLAFELAVAVIFVRLMIRRVVLFAVVVNQDAGVLIEGETQIVHVAVLRGVLHGHEVFGGAVGGIVGVGLAPGIHRRRGRETAAVAVVDVHLIQAGVGVEGAVIALEVAVGPLNVEFSLRPHLHRADHAPRTVGERRFVFVTEFEAVVGDACGGEQGHASGTVGHLGVHVA